MAKRLSIPDEFQADFERLVRLLPHPLQSDVQIQNSVWVYFKFGGDKLARHGIEIIKNRFQEQIKAKTEKATVSGPEMTDDDLYDESQADDEQDSDSDDMDDDLDDEDEEDDDDYDADY